MSAITSHVNAATTELLGLSVQQRVRAIRSERWVGYPRAQKAIHTLEQILEHPRTTRMPSVAIFGDSGMGKTMLMQKFCSDHPPGVDPETDQHRRPVLALQMTSKPGERRFYGQIPSVPMMLRQRPAGSLPLRAEVSASDGYAPYQ